MSQISKDGSLANRLFFGKGFKALMDLEVYPKHGPELCLVMSPLSKDLISNPCTCARETWHRFLGTIYSLSFTWYTYFTISPVCTRLCICVLYQRCNVSSNSGCCDYSQTGCSLARNFATLTRNVGNLIVKLLEQVANVSGSSFGRVAFICFRRRFDKLTFLGGFHCFFIFTSK